MSCNYEGKKIFKVKYDWIDWSMKVKIDFEYPGVMDKIIEMVQFWSDWENRVDDNDGDYVVTFLKQLGQKVFYMSLDEPSHGIIRKFDWEHGSGEDGYYSMDGTYGISIIKVDDLEVNKDDFKIEEIG